MNKYFASTSPEVTETELAHAALSRSLAGECVVLLENDGTLPLQGKGKIALFGNGARQTVKGGTGSGDVNTRNNVTIAQGLENAGYTITTNRWLDEFDAKRKQAHLDYLADCKKAAAEQGVAEFVVMFNTPFGETAVNPVTEEDIAAADTDTAIFVIARNSGEGADRWNKEGDYLPFPEEIEAVQTLAKNFKKTILVLNIGGVMELTQLKAIEGLNSILLMSQLGNIGGDVLADVISGEVNPSGKLTDTWAKCYQDYPSSATFSHNNGDVDNDYYSEGIYVGYRYFDTFGVEPLYPFGYGKSYTTFSIETKSVVVENAVVKLTAAVTNTGACAGKEVVQAYYSAPAKGVEKPYQELAAFAKTALLQPGETGEVVLTWSMESMSSYCEKHAAWALVDGTYVIRVGSSSRDTVAAASIVLDERVRVAELKNLFSTGHDGLQELTHETIRIEESTPIVVKVSAASIPTKKVEYSGARPVMTTDKTEKLTMADVLAGKCTVEELTAQLTVEELASFCVGTLREGSEVVGNASSLVPGAAGDTSCICAEDRGIKGAILADGPAGLRLQPHFKTTKAGELIPGGSVIGDAFEPWPEDLDENDVVDYYQYCTAIPIGWALAQAWNPALLEQVGKMIGEEMEQFNVDIWLAPAMNIHRNPLCGRNFEYYSEDPLVAGKTAAGITRGVQSHPGKGTCIKHFAVNNQEDNRYFTNAYVSERALREIYLKGFEIAVKESQPLSIMTSYNLLNGVHTANCYDLLQSACRDEWGFENTIMTDWFTSVHVPALTGKFVPTYPISASTGCIYAGNDMQMPGCQQNVDDIVKAVRENVEIDGYRITLGDLQFNAANMLRVVAKTTR